MKEIQIFRSPQFGQVRIIRDDASGELLFCANDVTTALGYANGRDAVSKHVDEGDVAKRDTPIPNQYGTQVIQSVTYVTESGLYSLIFGSKQERAKQFKRWVTGEVLPSIRKTGGYSANKPTIAEQVKIDMAFADWSARFLNLNEASKLVKVLKMKKYLHRFAERCIFASFNKFRGTIAASSSEGAFIVPSHLILSNLYKNYCAGSDIGKPYPGFAKYLEQPVAQFFRVQKNRK